jgi:radical SAM superfamily enzyme YgiQ (UPF0313 family)
MRVLLVYPNAKKEIIGWGDMGAIAEPIALEYVAGGARLDGHEVRLLDLRLHQPDLEDTLTSYRPEVVGVTGYSMHVLRNLEVLAIAKALVPDCITVVGGHHATLEPTDFFEPQVDHVVVGEGVQSFRVLLSGLQLGRPVQDVPGVWSRVDGEFRFGGEPPPYDLGAIPLPDRTLVPEDRPHYFIDWMKPIALVRTTVGCPYRCTFCSLWRLMDGRYHKRDIASVVDELRGIAERYVFFVDDEPFLDPGRMRNLAHAIMDAGIQKEYFAYSRIDSVLRHLDVMTLWRDIGLRRLLFGIETIFDQELDEYNKRQKREDIILGLRAAREIGISLFCNFIINPSYTKREFDELVAFIRENEIDYPSFTILTPIPGLGGSYDTVIDRLPNGRPNWDYFDLQHPVTATTMPRHEFMHEFDNLYQVFAENYYNCFSPLTLQSYRERSESMREAYIALAARVLGIARGQRPPEGQPGKP